MAEMMTLEQVRDWHKTMAEIIRDAEKADALLREALPFCDTFPDLLRDGVDELRARITAYLSENGHG